MIDNKSEPSMVLHETSKVLYRIKGSVQKYRTFLRFCTKIQNLFKVLCRLQNLQRFCAEPEEGSNLLSGLRTLKRFCRGYRTFLRFCVGYRTFCWFCVVPFFFRECVGSPDIPCV